MVRVTPDFCIQICYVIRCVVVVFVVGVDGGVGSDGVGGAVGVVVGGAVGVVVGVVWVVGVVEI